jgi:hypothetical protein
MQAIREAGRVIITGTGTARHATGSVTVTGTGVLKEWALVSPPYPNLRIYPGSYLCECPTYPTGYVFIPSPAYPTKLWAAKWDGSRLTVTWQPLWDYNDDRKIELGDLARFAIEYAKGKWNLADFSAFGELYHRPSVYTFIYRRCQ